MNIEQLKAKYLGDAFNRGTGQAFVNPKTGKGAKFANKLYSSEKEKQDFKRKIRSENKKIGGYGKGSDGANLVAKKLIGVYNALSELEMVSADDNGLFAAIQKIRQSLKTFDSLRKQKRRGGV